MIIIAFSIMTRREHHPEAYPPALFFNRLVKELYSWQESITAPPHCSGKFFQYPNI
jgi:hypothetical protein